LKGVYRQLEKNDFTEDYRTGNYYQQNRNYGCRCKEVIYKGCRMIMLENEKLRLSILADKGSDIIEFLYKPLDIDFLWHSPLEFDLRTANPVTRPMESGSFFDIYEGGWQELFPSVHMPSSYKNAPLGFHGEALFLPWDFRILEDTVKQVRVQFQVRLKRTPYLLTKIITIRSGSPVVEFEETAKNEAREEMQFLWGIHPAFGAPFADEDCYLDLPAGCKAFTPSEDAYGSSILPDATEFIWPEIISKNGKNLNLSRVMPFETGTAFNVFITDYKEGWYALTNLRKKAGFGMKWDSDIFKYITLWCVYGGYYNYPYYGRIQTIAVEPWSHVPGNLDEAAKKGSAFRLGPLEEMKIKYTAFAYETGKRPKGFTADNKPLPV
jgi:hypothetical protein